MTTSAARGTHTRHHGMCDGMPEAPQSRVPPHQRHASEPEVSKRTTFVSVSTLASPEEPPRRACVHPAARLDVDPRANRRAGGVQAA